MTSSNGINFKFPAQRSVTWSFDVFFDLRPNKQLSKQSWGWWFETPSRPLWRHRNGGWRHAITSKSIKISNTSVSIVLSKYSIFFPGLYDNVCRLWSGCIKRNEIVWIFSLVKWLKEDVIKYTYILFRSLFKVGVNIHSAGSSAQIFVGNLCTSLPPGDVSGRRIIQLEMT